MGALPNAAAAPATVVGEHEAFAPLGNREVGVARRPESQETCRRHCCQPAHRAGRRDETILVQTFVWLPSGAARFRGPYSGPALTEATLASLNPRNFALAVPLAFLAEPALSEEPAP
jgi:hypothetical protein